MTFSNQLWTIFSLAIIFAVLIACMTGCAPTDNSFYPYDCQVERAADGTCPPGKEAYRYNPLPTQVMLMRMGRW